MMILLALFTFSFIVGKNSLYRQPLGNRTDMLFSYLFIYCLYFQVTFLTYFLLFENFIMHSVCFGRIHCPVPPFPPFPHNFVCFFYILSLLSPLSAASEFMSRGSSTISWKQQQKEKKKFKSWTSV